MRILKVLTYISVILFFITDAYSGMNLSKNADLLLNGHLTGDALKAVDQSFLRSHISIINSVYFAWLSAFLITLSGILNCFKPSKKS